MEHELKDYSNAFIYNDEATFLFTSESVGEGHPDKLCDQISDAVLDAHLAQDPEAKVTSKTLAQRAVIMIVGMVTSNATVDYEEVVRNVIKNVGYDSSSKGFDYKTCGVVVNLDKQTPDIAEWVNQSRPQEEIGAGDQGLMFGYATDETEECMPLTIVLAHKLNVKMAELRRDGTLPWLLADTRVQVAFQFRMDKGVVVPVRAHTIYITVQHDEKVGLEEIRFRLKEDVVKVVIPHHYMDNETILLLQPNGFFLNGGPGGSIGLTGRKLLVDTYGGWGGLGGGPFSGKDYRKIDRSAAYAARWVAKSLVKAGLCKRVLVQISYVAGMAEPLSVTVQDYGTSQKTNQELMDIILTNFDLRPGVIVKDLDLKKPIYQNTATFGHFGRDGFPWEVPKTLIF